MAIPDKVTIETHWKRVNEQMLKDAFEPRENFFDILATAKFPREEQMPSTRFDPSLLDHNPIHDTRRANVHRELEDLKQRYPKLWIETMRQSRDARHHLNNLHRAIIHRTSEHDFIVRKVTDSLESWFDAGQPTPKVTFKQDDLLLLLPTP